MSGTLGLAVALQAGAEYAVTTTRKALAAPQGGLQQVIDGWVSYARENTWVVVAGAVVGVLLLRWVFSAPRVR
jgi:hypothetical protein